jgi:adenylate cyclase
VRNPLFQSSGRRFLKRLGFALVQAVLVGGLVGSLLYFRVPRTQLEEEGASPTLIAYLSEWVEAPERATYDIRVKVLGEWLQRQRRHAPKGPDRVVVVTVDDDTLANARQSEYPGLASYPWPREITGGMTQRLIQEGASAVLLDMRFPELSPRTCELPRTGKQEGGDDDAAFRGLLDQAPGRSVLAFSWSVPRASPPALRLWPYRVRVGAPEALPEAHALAQRVLAAQRPAFLLPEGARMAVWAGVEDERDGQLFTAQLGLPPTKVEERSARDDDHRFTALDLFVSLAEVEVEGLDASRLLQVRNLRHPVAPLLSPASLYGAATALPDPDGVVRGLLHLVSYAPREGVRHVLPSLPLATAMQQAGTRKLRYANGLLHVGEAYALPMDETGFSLVRWETGDVGRSAGASVFRTLRAWNILSNLFETANGRPPRADHDLEGRAVVLTHTSSYATDYKPTPIGKVTPGGALLAQSLDNLLKSEGILRAPPDLDLMLTVGMAFLGAAISFFFSSTFRSGFGATLFFSVAVLTGLGYCAAAGYVFVTQGLWIAVVGPLAAMGATFLLTTLYAVRTERELREFVNHALGRYVSPEVARLVTRDLTLLVRPERRQVSAYFSAIEGFTRLSEQMPPEQLVQFLNEYFTEMTVAVRSTGGQVDKYIGDRLMTFWGAPVRTDRHAHLACEAAMKMHAVLQARQPHWQKLYGHRIQLRAGINSGEAVVGDMGSELKSNYTVMGRAVNLASRLEGANKAYGTSVLVGEDTAQRASDAYVFREVDRVLVPGSAEPTRIHELLGRRGQIAPRAQELLGVYEQALTAFHQRRFDEALALFERGASGYEDPVSAVYAERCRRFQVSAPAEDWNGVYALREP